jgi:hypothetical protein
LRAFHPHIDNEHSNSLAGPKFKNKPGGIVGDCVNSYMKSATMTTLRKSFPQWSFAAIFASHYLMPGKRRTKHQTPFCA